MLWHAVASIKISGIWASLKSASQESEMLPGASDFLLAKSNGPSYQQSICRTGVTRYTWAGKPPAPPASPAQLLISYSPRPAEVPPYTPCGPLPAANTPCVLSQACFPSSLLNQPQLAPLQTWHQLLSQKQRASPRPEARWYPRSCLFPLN